MGSKDGRGIPNAAFVHDDDDVPVKRSLPVRATLPTTVVKDDSSSVVVFLLLLLIHFEWTINVSIANLTGRK